MTGTTELTSMFDCRRIRAFAAKQVLEIWRNPTALLETALAAGVLLAIAFLRSGVQRNNIIVECLYLPPLILVGTLYSDCLHVDVRTLLLLRAMLPDTFTLLAAKYFVMTAVLVPITSGGAFLVEGIVLSNGMATALFRAIIVGAVTLLLCGLCLGLASTFTSLEDVPDPLTMNGRVWILLVYWTVGPAASAAAWAIDKALLGHAGRLWAAGAAMLAICVFAFTLVLNILGARRLSAFE